MNPIVAKFKESIFSKMTKLAMREGAINLAQGFPDFEGPQWMVETVAKEFYQKKNQYVSSLGSPALRESVARFYQKHYQSKYCANSEVLITAGATEAIYLTCQALLAPGDEVVMFAPHYDSYTAAVEMAHAVPRVVELSVNGFKIEEEALTKACGPKTKLLILNSPHNPTGRVFEQAELSLILKLAEKYNFYILSDEVYEFLTYEKNFTSIASLPGAKERVIRISSVGKTLSFTGWKIGWACGPASVIERMHMVHQFLTFCLTGPIQEGVAKILDQMDDYLVELKQSYLSKRNFLISKLQQKGAEILVPEGSYFVLGKIPEALLERLGSDLAFCEYLATQHKLAVIPLSAFYSDERVSTGFVRFCFAKEQTTLQNGAERFPGP